MGDNQKNDIDTSQEKKSIFLLSIAEKFYENHLRKVQNSVTVASLLITANGIILIAAFNLFSIATKDTSIPINLYLIIGFYALIALILGSILFCLIYIHDVNPILFDLCRLSDELKRGNYNELLDATYDIINDYSKDNRTTYDRLQKTLDQGMLMFMGSILVLALIFVVIVLRL